jgi:ABC-type lipoprotein release transport system permease subunit
MRAWFNDLVIGVRLAVGGGRTSVARLSLSTVGIGIAVAVLLLASSVGPMIDARHERTTMTAPNTTVIPGVDPLRYITWEADFGADVIPVQFLYATGPTSPVPPGIPAIPADGEMYLTPALAVLLADSGSELLRQRLPYRVVGQIDTDTVVDPSDKVAYVGVGPEGKDAGLPAYRFGYEVYGSPMNPGLLLLLLLGSVALLVPVFIFVASSTRIAGAERDRRLSALRLVGADSRQVRRIAAAESLVSAVAGLILGAGLFLIGRELAEGIRIMDVSVYSADMVPTWWLAALVAVTIPILAVLTAQFALRRTIIEPLSVVRFSKPVKRRMLWRLVTVLLGVALLLFAGALNSNTQTWSYAIATGATLVLLGVPLLLPWVVERSVVGLHGGPSSWQLAIRRLQLDSGTSSRVVSGVSVVLASAIALQSVLLSLADLYETPVEYPQYGNSVTISGTSRAMLRAEAELRRTHPEIPVISYRDVMVMFDDSNAGVDVRVVDCATIEEQLKVIDCVDGQTFVPADYDHSGLTPGRAVSLMDRRSLSDTVNGQVYGTWTVPENLRQLRYEPTSPLWGLITTPGSGPPPPPSDYGSGLRIDVSNPQVLELVRTVVAPLRWEAFVSSYVTTQPLDPVQQTFFTARRGLLIGSLFTLFLAGTSLLVLALEHIRERRRPLAILAASGVPTGALARSLLWQIAVPIALGMVVAVGIGVSLAALVMRLSGSSPLVVDWGGVAMMALAALVLGLLVSVSTMPFLRSATRLSSMRTE